MVQLRFRRRRRPCRPSSFRLTSEAHLTPLSSKTNADKHTTTNNNSDGTEMNENLVEHLGQYATPLPVLTSQVVHLAFSRLYPLNFIRFVQESRPRRTSFHSVFQEEEIDTEESDTVDSNSFSCPSLRWFLSTRNPGIEHF